MTYIFIVNDLTHCATLLGNIWKKKYWYIKLYLPECIVNRMYCYKMEVSHTILIIKNGLGSGRLLDHYCDSFNFSSNRIFNWIDNHWLLYQILCLALPLSYFLNLLIHNLLRSNIFAVKKKTLKVNIIFKNILYIPVKNFLSYIKNIQF